MTRIARLGPLAALLALLCSPALATGDDGGPGDGDRSPDTATEIPKDPS